jgi:hypothetical protein
MALQTAGMTGARPFAGFRCQFCNHEVFIGRAPVKDAPARSAPVVYKTERCRCPYCGAKNPTVVNTNGKVRYHKCQKCDGTFRSSEE